MRRNPQTRGVRPGDRGGESAPKTASGPGRVSSLHSRRSPLAMPSEQIRVLEELELLTPEGVSADFEALLAAHGHDGIFASRLEIFQINLGRLCNMGCRHCHVDAGPDRQDQVMDKATVDACLRALDQSSAHTVDLTGGAPEMNPHFRYLVDALLARGKHVMDRCNLTILRVPEFRDLPEWLAERGVELVCSLPHHSARNTDAQRGTGAYKESMQALRHLNAAGYGKGDPKRRLTLVSNPAGAFLPGSQSATEAEWKRRLDHEYGIVFDALIMLNNMPLSRYLEWLEESGNLADYMERLVGSFNAQTVHGLMCRNTISVSWDGKIYDCDFNQMLEMPAEGRGGRAPEIHDFDLAHFRQRRIQTARHCFGCTAGAGSSCGGALAD